jgi:glycosyltransferase involved in cell wall biosynthesis
MIGVAIPAHNEEACLGACLQAVLRAAMHPQLAGEPVMVCVVLDACDDGTAAIVREWQTAFALAGCRLDALEIAARQVGNARAAGALHLIAADARWLAFTDADTRVSPQWLAVQVTLGAEVVCGSVAVDDWSPHAGKAQLLREHFARTYHDREDHRHIHGANLGVCALAYQAAGGFAAVACHEGALPRVFTSARLDARARGGFGDTLLAVTCEMETALPTT